MVRRGLITPMLNRMEAEGVSYEIFDRLTADPTDMQVEEGVKLYMSSGAQGLVLFGGGSPMDCGKAVAACVARPGKQVAQLAGSAEGRAQKQDTTDVGCTDNVRDRI